MIGGPLGRRLLRVVIVSISILRSTFEVPLVRVRLVAVLPPGGLQGHVSFFAVYGNVHQPVYQTRAKASR